LFIEIEKIAFFADVHGGGEAEFILGSAGFVDVAAEEEAGLFALKEVADGFAAGVSEVGDAVERGAIGGRMADGDHRLEAVEGVELFGEFFFGVFAWGVEGGGVGIAESGDVEFGSLEGLAVEVSEAEFVAEFGDLAVGFVIAGDDTDVGSAAFENFAHGIEVASEVDEVSGADVVIGFDIHEAGEGLGVAVDVGEEEELHGLYVSVWA
jgi:hypothetical protein